ncbi:hypothetical protein ERS140167_01099 [Staphylococcus schweitzeri]|nr:hypothetical protein ERS140162_01425 [Staphylococcus schweitzeri]CDR66269.1 hypothetical protein ERS140167_01099 [Staphylococcus schweitzeri]
MSSSFFIIFEQTMTRLIDTELLIIKDVNIIYYVKTFDLSKSNRDK